MSGPDISHHIAGLIEVVEGIAEAYDPIKDLRGLPEAFQEVNKVLPLMEQTLRDAKSPAKKLKFSKEAKALETVLYSCDEKADKLLEIFKKIAKNSKDQYDSSVYRALVIKQGKRRVETLMDGILENLEALVSHHMFPTEIQMQVKLLADAREQLAKATPSLAESDLAEHPNSANQYGDNNRQYNLFSDGTQKIADGHYFEAQGNQNFSMMPSKESVERQVA
ncbi:uncharacterized protein N7473_001591 [Penicillium subrubescens]|uniref:NACHT-NTPase and P-loop NTPases N-terminal domain-containing protein n=1 Tax=Penicillium subrubescens TaxID=1316194 RepID=A0A1Q5SQ04_9EURO|nr:uncharacterized protein N7473_001591 [Penicillium subrubescens]KAJ5904675.1 hypothetical protein N7473_001591 [Penicillium subrubescens]OKO90003.1 hypothetical protein PENSUB_13544 [Penicillium subrubescens]